MENKRKLSMALTIYIFVGAILFFALLAGVIQKSLSPADSAATGFGAQATRDLFLPTVEQILNTNCESILHVDYVTRGDFEELATGNYTVLPESFDPENDIPLICRYYLSDSKYVDFTVHTYHIDSFIDATRADLFNRINSAEFDGVIDRSTIGIVDYFFGTDARDPSQCKATMYHPLNDFEYADITYSGFDCDTAYKLNRELVTIFGHYLVITLDDVYQSKNLNTADLLVKWGFADLVESLAFYGL